MDETRCIIFEQPANGQPDNGERRGWVVEQDHRRGEWQATSLDGSVTCRFPSKSLATEYAEWKARLRSIPILIRQRDADALDQQDLYDVVKTSAAIQEKLANTDYGKLLAAHGITTVALNAAGDIVEYPPDWETT